MIIIIITIIITIITIIIIIRIIILINISISVRNHLESRTAVATKPLHGAPSQSEGSVAKPAHAIQSSLLYGMLGGWPLAPQLVVLQMRRRVLE